jgi:hypothetical protein
LKKIFDSSLLLPFRFTGFYTLLYIGNTLSLSKSLIS